MKNYVYLFFYEDLDLNSDREVVMYSIGKAHRLSNESFEFKLTEKIISRYLEKIDSKKSYLELTKKSEIKELFNDLRKTPTKVGELVPDWFGYHNTLKEAKKSFDESIKDFTDEKKFEEPGPFTAEVMDSYWKQKRKELDHNLSGISYEDGWIKINPIIIILIIFTLILILTLPS